MNIYLGSIYPDYLMHELVKRKQHVDFPAQTFQHSLLKGMMHYLSDLRIVTSPVIRSSRGAVHDLCKRTFFSYQDTDVKEDLYVGTSVGPCVQMLGEFLKVYRTLKELFKQSTDNVLIIYALHSPFLLAAVMLKKRIKCSCVIVPDLPEYMSGGRGFFRRFGKKIDKRIIDFCVKRLDCFVLLSKYMREKLPIVEKPWVVMEGIYNEESITIEEEPKNNNEKIILYTGNLSARTGILDLLEAFKGIDSFEYRLWIRGNGETKGDVLEAQKDDQRIIYYDPMPMEELRKLQRKATALINPVRGSQEFTKYFFPSKTMEYIASGTPTIMYKLPCLPDDYFEHVFFIEEESSESMREKLVEVCEKSQIELDEFGEKASAFIKTQKNPIVQVKKVVELIDEVCKKKQ